MEAHPEPLVPAPWKCKVETYWLLFWLPKKLPDGIYDPLQASYAPFSDPKQVGEFTGGPGMIQIVRYLESPVGEFRRCVLFVLGLDSDERD